jgi:hypothetical protein
MSDLVLVGSVAVITCDGAAFLVRPRSSPEVSSGSSSRLPHCATVATLPTP